MAACGVTPRHTAQLHTARLDEAWGLKCGRVTQQHQPVLVMHICFELFLPTTRSRVVGRSENLGGIFACSFEGVVGAIIAATSNLPGNDPLGFTYGNIYSRQIIFLYIWKDMIYVSQFN